jgi:hypothetical protein
MIWNEKEAASNQQKDRETGDGRRVTGKNKRAGVQACRGKTENQQPVASKKIGRRVSGTGYREKIRIKIFFHPKPETQDPKPKTED